MDGIKARPLTFEEVIGQNRTKKVLVNALRTMSLSRAYLISGAWSVGKTTLASIFSRSILCENRDPQTMSPCNKCVSCRNHLRDSHSSFISVDGANFGNKDSIATVLAMLNYDTNGDYRIVYIDEVHRLSSAGEDALLKILETPIAADGTIFLFSTTEIGKMSNTLRGRCTPIPLERPTPEDVFNKLVRMCQVENIPFDRHALLGLATWSQGHFRDAENALRPLILLGGINMENVTYITTFDVEATAAMLVALDGDLSKALTYAEEIIAKYGSDAVQTSMMRVLLDAIRYGLSGATMDVPECVKAVYNTYGPRMASVLNYLVSRSKITDSRLVTAELVSLRYKMLKGDLDATSSSLFTKALREAPSEKKEAEGSNPDPEIKTGSILSQQRALKAASRKGAGDGTQIEEKLSKSWGPETVTESVSLRRS